VSFIGPAAVLLLLLLPPKLVSQLLLLVLPLASLPLFVARSGSDSLSTKKKRYAIGGKVSAKGPCNESNTSGKVTRAFHMRRKCQEEGSVKEI